MPRPSQRARDANGSSERGNVANQGSNRTNEGRTGKTRGDDGRYCRRDDTVQPTPQSLQRIATQKDSVTAERDLIEKYVNKLVRIVFVPVNDAAATVPADEGKGPIFSVLERLVARKQMKFKRKLGKAMRQRYSGGLHRVTRKLPRRPVVIAGRSRKSAYVFQKFKIVRVNENRATDRAIRKWIRDAKEDGFAKEMSEDDAFRQFEICFNGDVDEERQEERREENQTEAQLPVQRNAVVPVREMNDQQERKLFADVVVAIAECDTAFWFLVNFDRKSGDTEIKHLASSLLRKKQNDGIPMGGLMNDIILYAKAVKTRTRSTPENRARRYRIRKVASMSKAARAWLGLAPFERMRWKDGEIVVLPGDDRVGVRRGGEVRALVEQAVRDERVDRCRGRQRAREGNSSRPHTSEEGDFEGEGQGMSESATGEEPLDVEQAPCPVTERPTDRNSTMSPACGRGTPSLYVRDFQGSRTQIGDTGTSSVPLHTDEINCAVSPVFTRTTRCPTPMRSIEEENGAPNGFQASGWTPDDTAPEISAWGREEPNLSVSSDIVMLFNQRNKDDARHFQSSLSPAAHAGAERGWEFTVGDDNLDSCFELSPGTAVYGEIF